MSILMTMNIYIKPQNEELLRRYDGSMSGLVNRLLEDFFEEYPSAATGIRRTVDKVFTLPPQDNSLSTVPHQIDDPYENLVFESVSGRVADTELEDYIEEVTPELVKELKRRGQVR